MKNRLYYGDCLTIMQEMKLNSVDLIYLDPPFNSSRDYNAIYKDETGRPLPDQIQAFCDLWELDRERERALRAMPVLMREAGIDDQAVEFWRLWMNALRSTQPRLLAYLSYMTQRLLPMRGLLKPTGSIYLHCDPTASHYIKVMMDAIFGHRNFKNEIIWSYQRWTGATRHFQRMHDVLLLYGRTPAATFHVITEPYSQKSKHKARRTTRIDKTGRLDQSYTGDLSREKAMRDVWEISYLNSQAKERLGYSTQKPLALLDRIIRASSNEGDVVFDPFCGCATTLEAAHRLGRHWIGVDIAIHAIKRVAKVRLQERIGLVEGVDFKIDGVPRTLEGARDLWERDKYHFQKWAVEEVDGFVTSRQTADGGIDGRLYFDTPGSRDLSSMVLEVKGGANVGIGVVRDLRGVLERDDAAMAGLIVMNDPGDRKARSFNREMAAAGDLDVNGVLYPRMQMLTVEQILAGTRFNTPGIVGRGVSEPVLPLG